MSDVDRHTGIRRRLKIWSGRPAATEGRRSGSQRPRFIWPFVLPVAAFALAIVIGALLLWCDFTHNSAGSVSFIDALFIATSCVCVTGLSTIDTATVFNQQGQAVMMALMQLGGLGITTYSSLFLYLFTRRVFLSDRLAVGQALLHDQSFHLGHFLVRIVVVITAIELTGLIALHLLEPERIGLFDAAYLAISSFCNAGFAPWSDNLMSFRQDTGVNVVVMLLIILGGLGFAVIDDLRALGLFAVQQFWDRLKGRKSARPRPTLSLAARLALSTSAALILVGALCFFLAEYFVNSEDYFEPAKVVLPSFFQSVTCRTAGFNTVNIGRLTDLTLLVMIGLMFIGGSAGSCAGGFKTGSFRIVLGFVRSVIRGRSQVVVAGRAVSREDISKVFSLLIFSLLTIIIAVLILTLTEGGVKVHGQTPFQVLDIVFEVISALATVGLTTGLTPELSDPGKLVVSALMYIGRLGPIWLITVLQKFSEDIRYRVPEAVIPIG